MLLRIASLLVLSGICGLAADKLAPAELINFAKNPVNLPSLHDTILASLPAMDLKAGAAVAVQGGEMLFAVTSATRPELLIDDVPGPAMLQSGDLYYALAGVTTGRTHNFAYKLDGKPFGGKTDVAAWTPESYAQPGVPQGKLTDRLVHTSTLYPGMQSNYWVYTSPGYDPAVPAALMVWQDGQNYNIRDNSHLQNQIDNLTFARRIPVMVHVFIQPGTVPRPANAPAPPAGGRGGQGTAMRSIQYDTVDDKYVHFLRDEVLAEVGKSYNIRKDGYSRAIAGESSGAIAAFNAAWFMNDQFTRVLSRIGSFTSIQWKPNQLDGGNTYPNKIRKETKRNIRVWLQDGTEDLENQFGSWPLQSIQMANSLKMQGYDFHLSMGNGTHNGSGGRSEAVAELTWLWRDYDPAKTEQVFAQDQTEKDLPLYRIRVLSRPLN